MGNVSFDGVKATVGLSAFHFGIPSYSYYLNSTEKLNTKIIGHASVSIGIANSNLLIIPELIFVKQGSLQEIGPYFIDNLIITLEESYIETESHIPIIFILSPGDDP